MNNTAVQGRQTRARSALRSILLTGAIVFGLSVTAASATGSSDWLQFGYDASHSGNNISETVLNQQDVGRLHLHWRASLDNVADGSPAFKSSVYVNGSYRDMVFVITRDGFIEAHDAASGAVLWSHQNGPGSCRINNGSIPCYTTSSPAIFANSPYVYSYGLDGRVHKYQQGDGTEVNSGGWPETITLKPFDEKGSSALTAITSGTSSYLWVSTGGYPGDNGDYQGHVTVIDVATGAQHIFNTLCSNQAVHFVAQPNSPDCSGRQAAVWARAGAVYDPQNNRVYVGTGNGSYSPSSHNWADSILALNPDGTGTATGPLDSYTPANYAYLQSTDEDLGSTAPAILPTVSGSSVRNLAVQGGKDAMLRLLNLDNLSSHGAAGFTGGEVGRPIHMPQGGEVLTQPTVWINRADRSTWVFVANDNGVSALRLQTSRKSTPALQVMWTTNLGGTTPIVANNVLYYAGSNGVRALNPTSGAVLWADNSLGYLHWESPIVVNGTLYITDDARGLRSYGL